MRLAHYARALVFSVLTIGAFLVVAAPANAGCEYEGNPYSGTVECVSWDDDEQPGGDESSYDSETSSVSNDHQSGTAGEEPVCRDGAGEVIACTVVNENGETCYFSSAIGAGGGAGGSAAYLCEPPPDSGADDPDDLTDDPAAVVDPEIVAWRATTSMGLQAIDIQIAPTPVTDDPGSMGLVGLPVWMWTDDTAQTWGPQTASASDGPVSVTVTARVDRVDWDMGDGTIVTCTEPGTPFDPDRHAADDESPDCGHTYLHTSDEQPDGLYTVTATSYWTAQWVDNTGQTGTIPFELTATEQIRIGELQVIRAGE